MFVSTFVLESNWLLTHLCRPVITDSRWSVDNRQNSRTLRCKEVYEGFDAEFDSMNERGCQFSLQRILTVFTAFRRGKDALHCLAY